MTPAEKVRRTLADAVLPDVPLSVSVWADTHRVLPKRSSAEPGPWRTDRTPYLREILDCLSVESSVQNIIVMKGAQLGGSEVGLNFLGYVVDHSPGPMMIVQPTTDLAKRFSRQRIEPMVVSTARLRAKVAPARQRDSGNTVFSKLFPGGILVITGANSAVGLRSMPAQYVFLDEIDGYPQDVNDEGSPLALVEARQRTFVRRKKLVVSTPTIEGISAIDAAYQASDQRRYFVPCPACGERQPLEFERLTWSKFDLPPERAVYLCAHCERPIEERHKARMLAEGAWIPGAECDPLTRGYAINGLYSPPGWLSWGEIAAGYVAAKSDHIRLRTYINTVLGRTWRERGEAADWEKLWRRRGPYAEGTCPHGVLFLTCGCDVQRNRLVVEVVGWGRGKRSWSITWAELEGDTGDLSPSGPWAALEQLLRSSFPHELGGTMPIRLTAIDSGDRTGTVYDFVRRFPMATMAIKGMGTLGMVLGAPTVVDLTARGTTVKGRPLKLWGVGDDVTKRELAGWLHLETPTDGSEPPPGYCYFPAEYDSEYFKQITAEELVTRTSRIHRNRPPREEWCVIPGRQNHLLDARRYARAAGCRLGMDRLTEEGWNVEAEKLAKRAAAFDDETP